MLRRPGLPDEHDFLAIPKPTASIWLANNRLRAVAVTASPPQRLLRQRVQRLRQARQGEGLGEVPPCPIRKAKARAFRGGAQTLHEIIGQFHISEAAHG